MDRSDVGCVIVVLALIVASLAGRVIEIVSMWVQCS